MSDTETVKQDDIPASDQAAELLHAIEHGLGQLRTWLEDHARFERKWRERNRLLDGQPKATPQSQRDL